MPVTPATVDDFLSLLGKSGLIPQEDLTQRLEQMRAQGPVPDSPSALAKVLVQEGVLTPFHTAQLLAGKSKGFLLGSKYKVLERLGAGGMGAVFLCEHVVMRRLVAVKILPPDQAGNPSALERFHREARAVAQLKHPNIVAAHDVDMEGKLHFLVMEFVDGSPLDRIVRKSGPLPLLRACHYIRQAAEGLQHAHEAGLVHRDIKPANLLLGRDGILKLLDLGLARFFNDADDNLTRDHDANSMLGTADYMAPEQAINSTTADIRADIYSLGGTFYYLLVGESPFAGRSTAQKLMMHQMLTPTRVREVRADIPQEIDDLIANLLEKDPARRPQTPGEVAASLVPWTETPIPPPDEAEMPVWPPAIRSLLRGDFPSSSRSGSAPTASSSSSPTRVQPSSDISSRTGRSSDSKRSGSRPAMPAENGRPDWEGEPAGEPKFPEAIPLGPATSEAVQAASRVRKVPKPSATPRPSSEARSPAPAVSPPADEDDETISLQPSTADRLKSGTAIAAMIKLPVPSRSRLLLWVWIGLGVTFLGVMLGTVLLLSYTAKPTPTQTAKVLDDVKEPIRVTQPVVQPNPKPQPPKIATMKPERILKGHDNSVDSVCFTTDGRFLLSGSKDRTLRLWETATGNLIRHFTGHQGEVRAVAVLPDNKRALSASSDKTVRLWNLWTGDEIRQFRGHTGEVDNVACLPDGARFVSTGKDQTVRLWNLDTGAELKLLTGHQKTIFGLDVSPDGRFVLTGSEDKTVRRWDLEEGKVVDTLQVPGPVHRVKFSIDGRMAVLACDKEVWVWSLSTNTVNWNDDLAENTVRPLDGLLSKAEAAAFTADDRHLVSGDAKTLRIWDNKEGKLRHLGEGHTNNISDVAVSSDGRHAASCGPDKTICVWNLPAKDVQGIFVGQLRELSGHTDAIESVAWTPDGQRLLSTSLDKTVRLWDAATGKLLREFKGHTGTLRGLTVLADGKRAISASMDRTARLWNLETGEEIRSFEHPDGVHWVQCSSNGSQLLTAGRDGFIRLWAIDTGKELKSWQAYTNVALTAAFLPDGKRVVTGGSDKDDKDPKKVKNFVRLWNLQTGDKLDQRGQEGTPWRVDVSPDGQVVVATDRSTLRLWDLQTGQVNLIDVKMTGNNPGIASGVFSPDGRTLMVGCHDGSVRLIDVATSNQRRKLDRHTGHALGVAFSPDGKLAASGGRDNKVRIWQLPEFVAQ